ncbi:MAG TPA: DEAD/DEAH box helicase [Ignavibacteriaceae bacterium]|nr:DEAD/DEAH box helicase [Ignavibacteriaceae bacterium]
MNKIKFADIALSKELHKAIVDLGYEEATPIQSQSIPVLLNGDDAIGQAQTGTGKTAAFGIPAIEMLNTSLRDTQVIILCPTRELAIQVSEEMNKLAKYKKDVSFLPVYGGQPIERQLKALKKGVQIIIGTPGRVLDHIERGTIHLESVRLVVLDEADEMLDMGFRDDIELILKTTPKKRQTVMFSATMPKAILELTKKYQRNPKQIKVVHEVLTVPNTEQIYFEVKERNKLEALSRIIDLYNLKLSLIFCNTKRGADELVEQLQARGYSVDGLHGDMKQSTREKVLNKFRKGNIEILVATDVAARGLDIDNVEAVFNYDMPQDEEYYVHRIGRTGRAGKSGKAFTFVSGREIFKLRDIQKYIKTKVKLMPVPSYDDVEEMRTNIFIEEIKSIIDAGNLKKYHKILGQFINDDYSTTDVSAALLKFNLESTSKQEDLNVKDVKNKQSGGEVRLFFNVGRKDKVRPGDILGAIAGETGIPGKVIGNIDLYDKFCFVNIPSEYVDEVLDTMNGNQIKNKKVHVEIANKKD